MKKLKFIYIGTIAAAVAAGTLVGYARDRQPANDNGQNSQRSQRSQRRNGGGQPDGAAGVGQAQGRRYGFGGDNTAPNNGRAARNADNPGLRNGDNNLRNGDNTAPRQREADKSQPNQESRHDSSETALTRHNTANGYEETSASGRVRTRAEKESDGEHVSKFSVSGRRQSEEVDRADGSRDVSRFDSTGRVRQEEVVHADGSRDVSAREFGRNGNVRATETVKYDVHERIVNKTVTRTVNKVVIVDHYDRGRFGFVYHPVFVMRPFVSWYDPYWYTPAGVVIVHPFHYHWGWDGYGWYHAYYGPRYWTTYDVYPTPSYWVTDWMVASYLQDHYDAELSVEQARADAQAAREEADKAAAAAQAAQDQAEIADAKAAQAQAELAAKNADAKLAAAEHAQEEAGKPNPKATPIDADTKEALKNQIDQTIAEKKTLADEAQAGKDPVLPDVSKALADPKHIYPVSKVISVTSAKDSSPAGNLSEGDLLKVEPGQEDKLKNPGENDLITMRVMTSKGDDGEVAAGSLVNVSVHDLQDFDSEFRAKLDSGLQAADQNKDAFKQGATGT